MDRYTRHQLKESEIQSTYEQFEQFARKYYREIIGAVVVILLAIALASSWHMYSERQEAAANNALAAALKTFHADVGVGPQGAMAPGSDTFATVSDKYKKAEQQFSEIASHYPRQDAGRIALYHLGICQASLGDHQAAIQTLKKAADSSDKEVGALARYALAGELTSTGKSEEAARIYQDLADHPTLSVPKATALLALADLYRTTKPDQARALYERLQKEFASDATLASLLKDQLAELPKP